MKCPKCKIEIDPKMQTCPNCNTKLVVKCPKCGAETKIGTSSCKTCGFVFVKFCKKCGSANYLSAKQCRKCYTEFPEETPKNQVKTEPKTPAENKKETENTTNSTKISIIIDFINLPTLFDKFEDEEFRQKVILNIKTAIKLSFNVKSEYLVPKFSIFNITYTPNYNLTAKIQSFKEEFRKFNEILSETLGEDIYYKILISSNEKGKEIVDKLNYGAQDDIIVTSTLYDVLKEEMNLIKISQDTYKVISPVTEELSKNTEQIKEYSALDKISKALVDSKNKINAISINAPQGVGKTHLINNLQAKYAGENVLFLRGQCSALTQISPMGLIQDIFIT